MGRDIYDSKSIELTGLLREQKNMNMSEPVKIDSHVIVVIFTLSTPVIAAKWKQLEP